MNGKNDEIVGLLHAASRRQATPPDGGADAGSSTFTPPASIAAFNEPRTRAAILVALVLCGGLAWGAWTWVGAQPITPAQRQELSALVGERARLHGMTRQAVWEEVKTPLGVRRIDDIRRADYDQARAWLTARAR
ncbi:MAG: hypothetical protein HQL66_00555 [Magnetococcales bacterium]|nr:hypothetical protein [Magnetococcales bacterium]